MEKRLLRLILLQSTSDNPDVRMQKENDFSKYLRTENSLMHTGSYMGIKIPQGLVGGESFQENMGERV